MPAAYSNTLSPCLPVCRYLCVCCSSTLILRVHPSAPGHGRPVKSDSAGAGGGASVAWQPRPLEIHPQRPVPESVRCVGSGALSRIEAVASVSISAGRAGYFV